MTDKRVIITRGRWRNTLGIIQEDYLCKKTNVRLYSVKLFPDETTATLKRYEFLLKDFRDELLFDY